MNFKKSKPCFNRFPKRLPSVIISSRLCHKWPRFLFPFRELVCGFSLHKLSLSSNPVTPQVSQQNAQSHFGDCGPQLEGRARIIQIMNASEISSKLDANMKSVPDGNFFLLLYLYPFYCSITFYLMAFEVLKLTMPTRSQ